MEHNPMFGFIKTATRNFQPCFHIVYWRNVPWFREHIGKFVVIHQKWILGEHGEITHAMLIVIWNVFGNVGRHFKARTSNSIS